MSDLDRADCDLILQALTYTRRAFEAYDYPTPEGRRERLADVEAVTTKIRALRKSLPRT